MTWVDSIVARWIELVIPWAIELVIVGGLVALVLGWLRDRDPGLRVGLATIALLKAVLPPVVLPVGLVSIGATDGLGSVQPLGAPLATLWLDRRLLVLLCGAHAVGVVIVAARIWMRSRSLSSSRGTMVPSSRVQELAAEVAAEIGLRCSPRVRVASGATVPYVIGAWRPIVVLPRALADGDAGTLRALLAHELIHVRSGDLWLAWLRSVAAALWWWHPVARSLARAHVDAIEERVDERVLGLGLARGEVYARSLLEAGAIALSGRLITPAAAAAGSDGLERRIRRLARTPRPTTVTRRLALFLVAAVLVLPTLSTGATSATGLTRQLLFFHPTSADAVDRHDHQHGS